MMCPYTQAYLPFGDLIIHFHHANQVDDYVRTLDLESAVASVTYKVGHTNYKREYFTSFPDQAFVMQFECSTPKALHFIVSLSSQLKSSVMCDDRAFVLTGRAPKHVEPNYVDADEPIIYADDEGMRFAGRLAIKLEDGHATSENGQLTVKDATKATLYFTAATSFNGHQLSPVTDGRDPVMLTKSAMDQVLESHLKN